MLEPLLQPLRIPAGWRVAFNNFREVDAGGDVSSPLWLYFGEDLLQLEHEQRQLLLDLGWYPASDPAGSFYVVLIERFEDQDRMIEVWDHPLAHFSSRSRTAIVAIIEEWLHHYESTSE